MKKSIKIGKWKLGIFAVKHRRGKSLSANTQGGDGGDAPRQDVTSAAKNTTNMKSMPASNAAPTVQSAGAAARNDWQNQVI